VTKRDLLLEIRGLELHAGLGLQQLGTPPDSSKRDLEGYLRILKWKVEVRRKKRGAGESHSSAQVH